MFGFINLDKPVGMSSREALDAVAKRLRYDRLGHAGTLDPLASGVLVLAVERATRLISLVQDFPKRYVGTFRLGLVSDTQDSEGECREVAWQPFSREQLQAIADEFIGERLQAPPLFSALKVNGQRAYKLGRRGADVQLPPRAITVHDLRILDVDPPVWSMEILCAKGTYVRTLGHDIGQRLGSNAVMTGLVRTSVGPFTIERSLKIPDIRRDRLEQCLTPVEQIFPHWPTIELTATEVDELRYARLSSNLTARIPQAASKAILKTPGGEVAAILRSLQGGGYGFVVNRYGQ